MIMEYSSLYDLIKSIEYGTKLHIGVIFFGNYGNEKCIVPYSHQIHSSYMCKKIKNSEKEYKKCYRCRNIAIGKAIRTKKAFGGLCINGIYEYTRPVVVEDDVACIIYIGNILTDGGYKRLKNKNADFETFEKNFSFEMCESAGMLIERYIRILLEKYPIEKKSFNSLINNIKSYIHSNIEYNISITSVAKLFHYNEVYLGRLFKKETGFTFKEYINDTRMKLAADLLSSGDSVTNISQRIGFNDVTYFNRQFKKYYKLTPTEYKKGKNF